MEKWKEGVVAEKREEKLVAQKMGARWLLKTKKRQEPPAATREGVVQQLRQVEDEMWANYEHSRMRYEDEAQQA